MTQSTQFSSRDVPWAKIGTVIDKPVTAAQAMKLAGLDFKVERKPMFYTDGKRQVPIPNRSVLARRGHDEVFGIVADVYEIVQFSEAFEFIDSISPEVVTAGQMRGGHQAFMVVRAPDHFKLEVVDGDKHELYVILRTSHNCSKAIEITIMALRGLCMNQMPISSFGRGAEQRWSIRHTRGAKERLKEAQRVITRTDAYAVEYAATAEHLAKMDLEIAEAERVLKAVMPDRPKRQEAVDRVLSLFHSGETVGHHDTGWGLVNAVGEYYEHHRRGGNDEARMLNALAGSTFKMVNRTTQMLMRSR